MKKKISFILAFLMAASMLAGCKKTDEDSAGIPDVGVADSISLTQMKMPDEEETTETTTEETEETTTEETEETEETTEATTSETSETSVTSETAETMAEAAWRETELSETLYVSTACYSRQRAIVGSESVKKYDAGTKIEIVAVTDTGYYKLADGTFIHSDYVTDTAPAAQTTTAAATETTKKKTTTTASTEEEPKDTSSMHINSSYTKSYESRYPYQQLSSAEQQLYRSIVEAAENFKSKVTVPEGLLSDDIFKVYCIVYNNEPQLFWLSTSAPTGYGSITLTFELSRSEAEAVQKQIDATVSDVMRSVNGYTSTVSKLKVIHDWVVTHNSFSLTGTYETCSVYNGLAGHGELQCQGYAKTTQYLCDMAGIECMTVVGNNTAGSTHAWNVVYCENGYYILDTTWDDPRSDNNRSSYVRHVLFLANDSMIKNSHLNQSTAKRGNGTRVKLFTPPSCTSSACYYFKAYGKEYSDLDSAVNALYAEFDAVLASGTQAVHIRVSDHSLWETLMSDDYTRTFQKYVKSKDSSVKAISRQKTLTEDINVVEFDIQYN